MLGERKEGYTRGNEITIQRRVILLYGTINERRKNENNDYADLCIPMERR